MQIKYEIQIVRQLFLFVYFNGLRSASGYLERDIKELAQVGKLNEFYDFLVFMAARTSQELKYSEISSAIGISAPTAKAWVSILERSRYLYSAYVLNEHYKKTC